MCFSLASLFQPAKISVHKIATCTKNFDAKHTLVPDQPSVSKHSCPVRTYIVMFIQLTTPSPTDYKQLLDEVFAISGIIKVISLSLRLRLITLTETLIIPDIAKTESNNCFIIHCFTGKQNNGKQFQHLCPSRLPASERFFP